MKVSDWSKLDFQKEKLLLNNGKVLFKIYPKEDVVQGKKNQAVTQRNSNYYVYSLYIKVK